MVCERTHTKMTRRACLVRQGLLPRSEEQGPIRHVPMECRDCPQGKRIAQEEKQEKMTARQKSYEGPFACAKCGEGEEEGRAHGGRGLCTRCYAAETKKGTLSKWKLSPPIPKKEKKDKSVILDSPITVPKTAQEEEKAPDPAEDFPGPCETEAAGPEERQAPDPIVLTFGSERNRHLRGWLELMAIVNRRILEEEIYISLEHAANTFLERNSVLRNPETKQKFLEKVKI